jgi:hypothetical protein
MRTLTLLSDREDSEARGSSAQSGDRDFSSFCAHGHSYDYFLSEFTVTLVGFTPPNVTFVV